MSSLRQEGDSASLLPNADPTDAIQYSALKMTDSDFTRLPSGGILWHASLILLHQFEKLRFSPLLTPHLKSRLPAAAGALPRVLELGSGSGDLGIALCQAVPSLDLIMTERKFSNCWEVTTARVAAFKAAHASLPSAENLRLVELEWGTSGTRKSGLWDRTTDAPAVFDVVIAAECVYAEEFHGALLETLLLVTAPGSEVWFVLVQRPFCLLFFALMHDCGQFQVDAVDDFDKLGMGGGSEVIMLKAVRR